MAARATAAAQRSRSRHALASANGNTTKAIRTAFPGRTSASSAMPRPTSANRGTDGPKVALVTSHAHRANAAANTGSLEISWNISA